jgi:putative ABC transport system permease protein
MTLLTIRGLWAHKLRFLLTGIAVMLGVAFMAGTMVLTDTMGRSFDALFASANADVDVVVQQPETIESELGDGRERVPAATLATIQGLDGVRAAAGSLQGFAQLVKADGSVSSLDGLGMTIGANWIPEELSPFDLATGRAPEAADEAILDQGTAEREGWLPGDAFEVVTQEGNRRLTLVGTATMGDLEGIPGSSLIALADGPAQELFGQPGHYDAVVVAAEEGVDAAALADEVDAALGAGTFDVLTAAADTAEQQSQFEEDLSFFNQFLLAFAYVSLFVGTFIIYNTFSIVVAQRKRDMAMLRAIGAGRRQLLLSVLVESVAVGVVASAVGLAVVLVMSMGLRELLSATGLEIPSGDLVVSTGTVVTAFVVGLTVTVLSAVAPAVRASRIAPIAALREVDRDDSGTSIARALIGLLLAGGGVAAFAAGLVAEGTQALQLVGVGAVGTIVGVFVLGPVIARPAVAALGWPLPLLSGMAGRLARENATRNPKRTSATASALMIGVALVGFITILAASTKASVEASVDRSMRADYVIDSGAWGEGGFSPDLAAGLTGLTELDAISPLRSAPIEVDGRSTTVDAVDTGVIDRLFDLEVVHGAMADVGPGSVAIDAGKAAEHGVGVGDEIDVLFGTGTATLAVAAIFDEPIGAVGGAPYVVDLATFEANVTDQFDRQVFVTAADGVPVAASTRALEAAIADLPNAELQNQAQFKESITSEIDQMLNLIYGLLALAVVIALIGIANTLALSVHERTRELGLLRAVGMGRRQLRTSIRWESVLIALLGTALGAVLAIGGAWGSVRALGTEGVTTFTVPPGQMLTIVGLAAVAGVVAALGPARRAARLDVLAAIATS